MINATRACLTLALLAAIWLFTPLTLQAQSLAGLQVKLDMDRDMDGKGTWVRNTGWLFLQHNKPQDGPHGAYIPFTFGNTSGTTLSNLTATLSGITGMGTIRLGGGSGNSLQTTSQILGSLAPGESRQLYWFIEYDNVFNAAAPITMTVSNGANSTTYNATLRTVEANRTSAGGINQSIVIGEGAVVGQTIWVEAINNFGGYDTNNFLLVQPTGAQFPAGCFQLTDTEVMASNVTAIPVGAKNQIWFIANQKQTGSGYQVRVRYFFKYRCSDVSARIRPFASQTKGGTVDFSGSFDGGGGDGGGAAAAMTRSSPPRPTRPTASMSARPPRRTRSGEGGPTPSGSRSRTSRTSSGWVSTRSSTCSRPGLSSRG